MFCKSLFTISTAILIATVLSTSARATISYGPVNNGLSAPDHFTSFDGGGLAEDALIGSAFAGTGFTFTGGLRFRSCGAAWPNSAGGFTPSGYGTNLGPSCTRNTGDDSFSIHLSADADAASFTSHTDVLNGGAIRLEVLNDGASLESFDITEANESWCCTPRFVRIDGLIFDEIRVTELLPVSQSWITIDNLAFNEATVIPEPAGAGLILLGVLTMSAAYRRQTARISNSTPDAISI
jgi:hypothetical protein